MRHFVERAERGNREAVLTPINIGIDSWNAEFAALRIIKSVIGMAIDKRFVFLMRIEIGVLRCEKCPVGGRQKMVDVTIK